MNAGSQAARRIIEIELRGSRSFSMSGWNGRSALGDGGLIPVVSFWTNTAVYPINFQRNDNSEDQEGERSAEADCGVWTVDEDIREQQQQQGCMKYGLKAAWRWQPMERDAASTSSRPNCTHN